MEFSISCLFCLSFLVYLFFGAYILKLNPGSPPNRLFFAVCLCLAQWTLFYAAKHYEAPGENIWFWYRWSHIGKIFFTSFIVHFFLSLTRENTKYSPAASKLLYAAIYAPAAYFTLMGITGNFGASELIQRNGFLLKAWDRTSPVFIAYTVWYLSMMGFAIFTVFNWRKNTPRKHEKSQAGIILISGIIAFALGTTVNFVFALMDFRFPALGNIIALIWIAGIWHAIAHHGFLKVTPRLAINSILNSLRDAIIMTDKHGVISWANPESTALTGYSGRELKGSVIEILLGEEGPSFSDIKKTPRPAEITVISKEGIPRPASFTSSPVRREGKNLGYVFSFRDMSSVKKAEEELRKSESRFRDIAESSGEYIWELDSRSRYTYASGRIKEVLGREADEIIGKTPFEFMPEEISTKTKKAFENISRQRKDFKGLESRMLKPGGEQVWTYVSGRPVYDEKGAFTGYRGTTMDITPRKEAEEALKESESRFRDIAEAAGEYIWELDSEFRHVYLSDRVEDVAKIPKEAILGRTPFEFMPPEDAERMKNTIEKILEEGKRKWEIECRFLRADGEKVWIQIRAVAVSDEKGNITGYRGTSLDITQRKKNDAETKALNEERALLLNNIPTHIWYMKDARTYGFANSAHLEFLGRDIEDVEDRDIEEILPPEEALEMIKSNEAVISSAKRTMVEKAVTSFDGKKRMLGMAKIPILDPEENTARILCTAADITDKKLAEERIRESIKIKENFISIVSHELRTPLTIIKEGVLVVLDGLAGPLSGKQRDLLSKVDKNIERLSRLISDVLDFRRIESGEMRLQLKENDLNKTAAEAMELMREKAEGKGLELKTEFDGSIPAFEFDRDKITQAVLNLMDNAVKFTESGAISVRTEIINEEVRLSVADTGKGISDIDPEKLYGMFEQGGSVLTGKPGGFGLGLAITKQIVKLHGGEITAQPNEGKGTVFSFTLPL